MKIGILVATLLINVRLLPGQSDSLISNKSTHLLSKGINLGYRTGLGAKNNELLLGYYFNLIDGKGNHLWTFDNDVWSNFKRVGFNSTISYANHICSISYSNEFFYDKGKMRFVPGVGLNFGYIDLINLGVFYHCISSPDMQYPQFQFKLVLRPSFINIIAQNPDGSEW